MEKASIEIILHLRTSVLFYTFENFACTLFIASLHFIIFCNNFLVISSTVLSLFYFFLSCLDVVLFGNLFRPRSWWTFKLPPRRKFIFWIMRIIRVSKMLGTTALRVQWKIIFASFSFHLSTLFLLRTSSFSLKIRTWSAIDRVQASIFTHTRIGSLTGREVA